MGEGHPLPLHHSHNTYSRNTHSHNTYTLFYSPIPYSRTLLLFLFHSPTLLISLSYPTLPILPFLLYLPYPSYPTLPILFLL